MLRIFGSKTRNQVGSSRDERDSVRTVRLPLSYGRIATELVGLPPFAGDALASHHPIGSTDEYIRNLVCIITNKIRCGRFKNHEVCVWGQRRVVTIAIWSRVIWSDGDLRGDTRNEGLC